MLISGEWVVGSDQRRRPTISAAIELLDRTHEGEELLLDTGADQTVFTEAVWKALGSPASDVRLRLDGVGGSAPAVQAHATLLLTREDGTKVRVSGPFAFCTGPTPLETSVLGRDVRNNFDVILSYKRGQVFLLAPNHHFQIVQP